MVYISCREWWSLILHGPQHLGYIFGQSLDGSEAALLQYPPNLIHEV